MRMQAGVVSRRHEGYLRLLLCSRGLLHRSETREGLLYPEMEGVDRDYERYQEPELLRMGPRIVYSEYGYERPKIVC